jgi:hypothetical protein
MPVIKEFVTNPEAQQLHTDGLAIVVQPGAYSAQLREGEAKLSEALDILTPATTEIDEESRLMQKLRIGRDLGFTGVRRSVRIQSRFMQRDLMKQSFRTLLNSRDSAQYLKILGRPHYSKDAWRFLKAESGASIGLIGRWVTVENVLTGSRLADAEVIYKEAHKDLVKGSNLYYLVSNAMKAARNARIDSHSIEASQWLSRAHKAISTSDSSPDYEAAVRTYEANRAQAIDRQAALEAIKSNP